MKIDTIRQIQFYTTLVEPIDLTTYDVALTLLLICLGENLFKTNRFHVITHNYGNMIYVYKQDKHYQSLVW